MDDTKYFQILKLFLLVKKLLIDNPSNFEIFISHMGNLQEKYLDYTNIDDIIKKANDFIYTILYTELHIILNDVDSKNFTKTALIMINNIIPDKIITKKSIDDINLLYKNNVQQAGKRSKNIRRSKRSKNIRRSKRSKNIRRSKKY